MYRDADKPTQTQTHRHTGVQTQTVQSKFQTAHPHLCMFPVYHSAPMSWTSTGIWPGAWAPSMHTFTLNLWHSCTTALTGTMYDGMLMMWSTSATAMLGWASSCSSNAANTAASRSALLYVTPGLGVGNCATTTSTPWVSAKCSTTFLQAL